MYSFILNGDWDVTPWHIANGNKSHLVNNEDGGAEFFELLENPGPNNCFLITPEFTWEMNDMPEVGDEYFTSKGIYPHNCSTEIKTLNKVERDFMFNIHMIDNNLIINSYLEGNYTIKLFEVNGRLINILENYKITAGLNKIKLITNNISRGIYFAEISMGTDTFSKQFFIR